VSLEEAAIEGDSPVN